MTTIEENISAELPEDDQLNDGFSDTNSIASARDKNTPIGVRSSRNAVDNVENLAGQQRIDKNTPIG
jgi:hypothetical protein